MSSEKIKKTLEKKAVGTYFYPQTCDKLKDISRLMGISGTQIQEAATLFFCDSSREFREKVYRYYEGKSSRWIADAAKSLGCDTTEQVLRAVDPLEEKEKI